MVYRDGGEPTQPPVLWRPPANIEDSAAPAEFLNPEDLQVRLDALRNCRRPALLLKRAWLYFEYPLATVDTENDDAFFDKGNEDIERILTHFDLAPRDPRRFGAAMLQAYEPSFRLRAAAQTPRLWIPPAVTTALQENLATIMLDYLEGADPTEEEHGRLAELLVATYLLDGDFFPFISSYREEANMFPADNHDFYTLHKYGRGKMRKVPISVKYRTKTKHPSEVVTTLYAGRMALQTARETPSYDDEEIFSPQTDEKLAIATATRLAADIMVCHIQGEELSTEDNTFRTGLIHKMSTAIILFARTVKTPNYLTNARLLRDYGDQIANS